MSEVVKLQHPITVDGREISELNLRRITVGDLELMDKETTQLGKSIRLVALAAELSPDDVRRLDAADFQMVSERVAGFLG